MREGARRVERRLYLSDTDKKIFGVCGGLADYFRIDATLLRLVWVLSIVFVGSGLLLYLICALVIPRRPRTAAR